VRVRPAAARGWASQPTGLEWRATPAGRLPEFDLAWGASFVAETPIARYVVNEHKHEVIAEVMPREPGRPRYVLGSFPTVAAAMQACERDHERRLAERTAG